MGVFYSNPGQSLEKYFKANHFLPLVGMQKILIPGSISKESRLVLKISLSDKSLISRTYLGRTAKKHQQFFTHFKEEHEIW